MDIPKKVKAKAFEHGYNSVSYVRSIDDSDYYSVGLIDDLGDALPTGLPAFIIVKNNKITIVSGNDGLELCGRLY